MLSLTALWLPILVSAVIVFVASSVIHMAPLWHRNDFPKMPREDEVLQALLAPVRKRRAALACDPDHVLDVLRAGTMRARAVTQATLDEVRCALGLFALDG